MYMYIIKIQFLPIHADFYAFHTSLEHVHVNLNYTCKKPFCIFPFQLSVQEVHVQRKYHLYM